MRIDGVTFVDSVCEKMTEKEFIKVHSVFWPQLTDAERKKKLVFIYKKIKSCKDHS